MQRTLLLALALVAGANAECPNACSGAGVCSAYDTCVCYRNFEGADCSLRTCPFGKAHVDSPKGDLDGSADALSSPKDTLIIGSTVYPYGTQEQFPNMTDSGDNELENTAHYYMECANKGICDRKTGECECFTGYEGSACQRASCPNDCSGHGTCEHIQTLAANEFDNIYELWDADMTMGCACDAGYTGPDCSLLDCKYGIDPLYIDDAATARVEEVAYSLYDDSGSALAGTYALKFYDVFGEDYKTDPIQIGATCDTVTDSLEALPDTVIPQLSIVCERQVTTDIESRYALTFTGNPGYLKQLEVDMYLDGQRATVTATSHPDVRVFSTGRRGEFMDYFATQCAGVKATIDSNTPADINLGKDSSATLANELNSGYKLGLDTAEVKALKICLGDADGETSNNVEVYNWDYGSYTLVDGSTYAMDSYPHAIKLVDTTPIDNFDGGYYFLVWWAATDGEFILANAPDYKDEDYSSATEYHVYTTDGIVERVIFDRNLDGEITTTTMAGHVDPRITAYWAKFSNVLYTSFDVSCETGHLHIEPCLEKGDLLFLINSPYLVNNYDASEAASSSEIYDLTRIDDSQLIQDGSLGTSTSYNTGSLYTIEKIYNAPPTAQTFYLEDRYRIVLDKNVNFQGDNVTTSYVTSPGSSNSSRVGVVNLFKFTPATTGNYQFVSQCSNRGACDSDAGECECFKGYTGDDCATQSSLAV